MKTGRSAEESHLERSAEVMKALGNPLRLRIVELLSERPYTVLVLSEALGRPQTVVSRELGVLRQKRIVHGARDGYFVRYSIIEPLVTGLVRHLVD